MRPPRQLRKDAALKRSATTLAMRTHAAGLRHMLLVSFEGDEFDQALAHAVSAERAEIQITPIEFLTIKVADVR